jgi:FKBP-type peptidyl-prolyl cis-trans isomerase FkpA
MNLFLYILLFIALAVSCRNDHSKVIPQPKSQEELMRLNKEMMLEEQEEIKSYIDRYHYSMEETKTGLHIMSISNGEGKSPAMQDDVTIAYKINLMDGTYCYSSDSSGLLTFRMGQSTEPSGLQEGLLHMKMGGKSLMIIPSWLAYGITGDGDKIGSSQPLVYEVTLVAVN